MTPAMRALFTLPLALLPTLAFAQTLEIKVTKPVECTRKTHNGDTLSMMYKGTLQSDGTKFDSSYDRGKPFKFTLGVHQVIQGWDQGLLDMCIGEGRKLIIPPDLAYGSQGTGGIPGGATLVFETELVGIDGVEAEPARPTVAVTDDTVNAEDEEAAPDNVPTPTSTSKFTSILIPTAATAESKPATTAAPVAEPTTSAIAQGNPLDGESGGGECNLLGDFALVVQGLLGLLAVSSLAVKRLRESPRRPIKIWFFDVSKQVFGSVLLHLANILMSMLSSGKFDVVATTSATTQYAGTNDEGDQPNPCSFYLLNLAIDTTIGIPILVLLLKILHTAFAHTPLANPPESIRSGNYGHPPRATWWLKQSIIYFLGLIGMKLCVLALFAFLPWIAWIGDWALRWTEGNTALQITFVMFVFPLIMNAVQYWIIDNFIKDPVHGGGAADDVGYGRVGDSEDGEDEAWLQRQRRRRESGDTDSDGDEADGEEEEPVKEANPKLGAEYDPDVDGAGGSRSPKKARTE
ncbi:hypothetical protein BDW02DRAFT_565246 [Decorospora gaudefroyi]|uniref:peptidylprolyl isomerase n=1 Tax=Decorospora gaudefroyi TaxID=184978 RepID=A0A6A5KM75_9PLEO|nr:hypothetical protein BDW02DRAFT_565246 [Decorospora gaudefroyi]